jgi:1-acyl-sn-glycerol-3-phosphate acyltransferase
MSSLIFYWRALRFALQLFYGLLLAIPYPWFSRATQKRLMRYWARGLIKVFGVKLETLGELPPPQQGRMLVLNHISWLDAMVVDAATPVYFVAKSEVKGWPLLGWLCRRVDTLFIRRGVRRDTVEVNEKIINLLQHGELVSIFPEGTTTTGVTVGHFHSSLLQGALDADALIQPVALRYHDGRGNLNEEVAYVGDTTFMQSLRATLRTSSLHATLVYLPVLSVTEQNRRELAGQAQTAIRQCLEGL